MSQGQVPICPTEGPVCHRNGSCLSRTLSRPKCLCLLIFACSKVICSLRMVAGKARVHISATRFYTPPPLEGKIATDTLTPFPAPVVYKISGSMGGGILYTTGAEAEISVVNFSKNAVPPLYDFKSVSKYQRPGDHPNFRKKRSRSEKGHSRSSRRVPGFSRSSSRNSKFHSQNTKFHSRHGIPRLEQYENRNSRSNSRNWWEPT